MNKHIQVELELEPVEGRRLASLCGPLDINLQQVEKQLDVAINHRDNKFYIQGMQNHAKAAKKLLQRLYHETQPIRGRIPALDAEQIHIAMQELNIFDGVIQKRPNYHSSVEIKTKCGVIKPRNSHQAKYLENILSHDISFGVGPAGTGKTYLAVAAAIDSLERQEVKRILLTRPAVEAGEKLGFLPGDLSQKVDPYLRPLYDALFDMLGFEKVEKLIELNVIEIAPLAYMRGRTLNDAFIILDESQNTTVEQMKMFLTRIGFNSRAVVTGDITQVDLPKHQRSGLSHVVEVLKEVKDISFTFFNAKDVVRHPVVARVVDAYEQYEQYEQAQNNKD